MLSFPSSFPADPPRLTQARLLAWFTGKVAWGLLATALLSSIRFVSLVLLPYVLGQAIDSGLEAGVTPQLWRYGAMLVGLGALSAVADSFSHILEVRNWLHTAATSVKLVGDHVTRAGEAITRTTATGKVVAVVATDAQYLGNLSEVAGVTIGAIVAYIVVAGLLLQESAIMAAIVLLGLPLVTATNLLVAIPLQKRQATHREAQGELTALASDTVSGLRILRGIGGEDVFTGRYKARSQDVRVAGVKVANTAAVLAALQVFLPGVLVVAVVWVSAALTLRGEITTGQLVAFYGYTAFLRDPVTRIGYMFIHATRAWVAAKKVGEILQVPADVAQSVSERGAVIALSDDAPEPLLRDGATGITIQRGVLTALVGDDPDLGASQLARFARLNDAESAEVSFAGRPITSYSIPDVRQTILFSGANPQLFSGKLSTELDVRGTASEEELLRALRIAYAGDVLDSMPDGLHGEITEKGRSLSGGQRQRVALARAVVADPSVLLLVEPTSAVDAHTERRIASQLAAARAGQTTVVVTASPLMLEHMDEVVFIDETGERARGSHHELMQRARAGDAAALDYYRLVTRRDFEEDHAAPNR